MCFLSVFSWLQCLLTSRIFGFLKRLFFVLLDEMLACACLQEAVTSVPNTRGEIVFQHGNCELPTTSFVGGRGGGR
jgi:hypothetical protein